MFWFILIALVIFFVYLFLSDREKMLKKIDENAGMRGKYSYLLSHLMVSSDSRISSLSRQNIVINTIDGYFHNTYSILETTSILIIKWNSQSPVGRFSKEWKFPINLSQHEMFNKMNQDIDSIIANQSNNDELMERINRAMNNLSDD
jgi:hypothetical protein